MEKKNIEVAVSCADNIYLVVDDVLTPPGELSNNASSAPTAL